MTSPGLCECGCGKRASRLTAADVAEVRRMIAVGLANVAIAERFGIARSTVSKIKTGARWAT